MKSAKYFQDRIDELLSDKEYYKNELSKVVADPINPVLGMMHKKSFTNLIKECEDNIAHYKKAVTAVKFFEYQQNEIRV